MASFINTNIASLNAQRNLASSQSALQTSLQRLSSGLRINSAKDDAAGLAIANRFTTQINGLDQAQRNANDGISLAQTADGALSSISDNLQRIRELAVQAANSTNSASDRAAINEEVQQRLQEIDRTASQTAFNGQKILDGNFGSANFQVGANAGETISVDLSGSSANMRTNAIGHIATTTSTAAVGTAAVATDVSLGAYTAAVANGTKTQINLTGAFTAPVANGTAATASVVSGMGAWTTAVSNAAAAVQNDSAASGAFTSVTLGAGETYSLSVGGVDIFSETQGVVAAADIDNAVTNSAAALTAAGISVSGTAAGGDLQFSRTDGAQFDVTVVNGSGANGFAGADFATGTNTVNNGSTVTTDSTFQMSIDGQVLLSKTGTVGAQVTAADLDNALTTFLSNNAGYTATGSFAGGDLQLTKADGTGIAITLDSNYSGTAGAFATPADMTSSGPDGTAGSAATGLTDGNFTMTLDGNTIIDQAAGSSGDTVTAADMDTALNTFLGTAAGSAYTKVSGSFATGDLQLTKNDGTASTGFVIANNWSGTAGAVSETTTTGTPSSDGAFTMSIDGHQLFSKDATVGGTVSASELDNALDTFVANNTDAGLSKTGSIAGGDLHLIKADGTAVAVTIDSNWTGTAGAFAGSLSGVGTPSGNVSLTDLKITSGSNTATDLSGFTGTADELAAEINKSVSGVYATVAGGKLSLTSSADIHMTGTDATGSLHFSSADVTASSGSLDSGDTLTAANANTLIQRVDSALGSVNSMRSTFGAIQNRFDSVISNLSSTSENLSAARSRIQDADFAAETASLTRGQILQQAGTAMLAQANSLPNNVLSLLR